MMQFSNKALRFLSVLLALLFVFSSQVVAANQTRGTQTEPTTQPVSDEPSSEENSSQEQPEPSTQESTSEEPSTVEPSTEEPTTEEPQPPTPGDADGNGRVTASDARIILRISVRLHPCDDALFLVSDLDDDGKITAADARIALLFSVGLPADYVPPQPPEPKPEPTPEPKPLPPYWFIEAKPISQFPTFPTGCESVATTILLRYHGFQITPAQFIDKYLDKGSVPYWANGIQYSPDPQKVFLGNPRSKDGWGIYVGGIERALKKFVDTNKFDIVVPKNQNMDDLCKNYIINNLPVVVWATVRMQDVKSTPLRVIGTNSRFYWYSPLHCLVLVGYDDTYYYFSDPNTGSYTKFLKSKTQNVYSKMGKQSIVLVPK